MKKLLLISVLCAWSTVAAAEGGPGGFPLPKDAVVSKLNVAGPKVQVYEVPRARSVVLAEVRDALKAAGFAIVSETPSPSGNAIRMELKKGGASLGARFTGDEKKTAIILTLP